MNVRSLLLKSSTILAMAGLFIAGFCMKGTLVQNQQTSHQFMLSQKRFFDPEVERKSHAYLKYMYGLLHERRSHYPKAIELFEQVKKLDPDSVINRLHLGVNLVHAGRKKEAAAVFDETASLNPGNHKVQVLTALLFASQNRYEEAINQFKMILETKPDHMFALSSLADLYVLFDQLEEAVKVYERIIEIKPDSSVIYFNMAIIESRLKRYTDAQKHLEEAVRLRPDHIEAHVALGLIYEMQNMYDEAMDSFESALDIDPVDVRIYHNLARLYYHADRHEEAISQYRLILNLMPRDVNAALDAAYLYIGLERYRESIDVLDQTLKNGVVHPKIYFMKGYALNQLAMQAKAGEAAADLAEIQDQAIGAFRDSLIVNPKYADAHFYLGVLLEQRKEYETAKYHFNRTIELDPYNAEAYNYLGYIDIELGQNLDEAINLVKKALALDPDNAAFLDSLGWAYYKKGIYAQAVVQLEEAVRLSGEDAIIREHLGDAYSMIGRSSEAIREWNKVIYIEPQNESAKLKIERIKK